MLLHLLLGCLVLGLPAAFGQQTIPSSRSIDSSSATTTATTSSISSSTAFLGLSGAWGDYGSLKQCQKACIAEGPYSGRYDTEDEARTNCASLLDSLNEVPGCIDRNSGCPNNQTAIAGAQQLLASFCSSVATAYSFTVPATTVADGSSIAAASTAGVPQSATSLDIITLPSAASTGSTAGTSGNPLPNSAARAQQTQTANANDTTIAPVKKGLSTSEKTGIGVGVGLGIPLIIGGIAALWLLSRRRKRRAAGGPYGPVMTGEKGTTESVTYSSPRMAPHEMQPMGSATPFLPAAAATRDAGSEDRHYEPTLATTLASDEAKYSDEPVSAVAEPKPYSSQQQDQFYAAQQRPATSRDISRAGTPPTLDTHARPATAHARLAPPDDDEPPSPISPVSPISPAGSRPASLMHNNDRHD